MFEYSHHGQIVLCRTNISIGGQKDMYSFVLLSSFFKTPLEIKMKIQICHIKKCNHFTRQLLAQHLLSQYVFILKNIIQQVSSIGVVTT